MLRIDQSFRRVARDAGLDNVTPHTLRHTAATWMAQANVPLWIISKYLGHTSSRTTEKIYAHHNPTFLVEAKHALEGRNEVKQLPFITAKKPPPLVRTIKPALSK